MPVADSVVLSRMTPVKELAMLLNAMRDAGVVLDYGVVWGSGSDALHRAGGHVRRRCSGGGADAGSLGRLEPPLRLLCPARLATGRRGDPGGSWPVQFLPVFSPLTREALELAETAEFEGVPFRVVSARHLAIIALSVGRAKDHLRILALLEANAVTRAELAELAARHGLVEHWKRFVGRFLDAT